MFLVSYWLKSEIFFIPQLIRHEKISRNGIRDLSEINSGGGKVETGGSSIFEPLKREWCLNLCLS